VRINVRKEAGIRNPLTGYPMELDVYLPTLNLAFEYQVGAFSPNLIQNLNSQNTWVTHIIRNGIISSRKMMFLCHWKIYRSEIK